MKISIFIGLETLRTRVANKTNTFNKFPGAQKDEHNSNGWCQLLRVETIMVRLFMMLLSI